MKRGRYPNCCPTKLLAFFAANPSEGLTYWGISKKFDIGYNGAQRCVSKLVLEGSLRLEQLGRGRVMVVRA
jgi:hypothetical protein